MSNSLVSYRYCDYPFVYECWYTGKVFMRRLYSFHGILNISKKGAHRISRRVFLDNCENDDRIVALLDNGDKTSSNV